MRTPLENPVRSEDYVAAEAGFGEAEARAVLRRQFIGSVAVAVAVMAAVALTAMRPVHGIVDDTGLRRVSAVQQPTFVAPADRVIALRQH